MACTSGNCSDTPQSLAGVLPGLKVTEGTVDLGMNLLTTYLYYLLYDKEADHVDAIVSALRIMAAEGEVFEDTWRELHKLYITHVWNEYPEIDSSGDEEYLTQFNYLMSTDHKERMGILSVGEDDIGEKCRQNDRYAKHMIDLRNSGYLQGLARRHGMEDNYLIEKFNAKLSAISFSKAQTFGGLSSMLNSSLESRAMLSGGLNRSFSAAVRSGISIYDNYNTRADYRENSPTQTVDYSSRQVPNTYSSRHTPTSGSSRNEPRTYNYNPSTDLAG